MASIALSENATTNISRATPRHYIDSATRVSRALCFYTAYERAEGSNAVAESSSNTRGEGTGPDGPPGASSSGDARRDPMSEEGMYEAKQQALDMDENTTTEAAQFVADAAEEGVRKAAETADTVGETAKRTTMAGAWKASREADQKIRETGWSEDW